MEGSQAKFDPDRYQGSPNVSVKDGYLVAGLGALSFLLVNFVVIAIGPSRHVKGDKWRWRNTLVSWIHAVCLGLWTLYYLLFEPIFEVDMILFCDTKSHAMIAFSLGYFVYDFFDYAIGGRIMSNYEVILHHIAVIWSFWYNIHYRVNIPYTVVALMVEVNSIFLHGRKLLQLHGWPVNHAFYMAAAAMNILTFPYFRLYVVGLIGWGVYLEWDRMTVTYHYFITPTMIVMMLINIVLFWRLIKSDILRRYRQAGKCKANTNGHVSNGTVKNGSNGVVRNGSNGSLHVD